MNGEENKKEYEMSYFLTSDIPEGSVDSAASELNSLITESGGGSVALEIPKRKRLSYPIKKQSEAYFGTAYFNIDAEGLDKIKKSLTLHKKLLRYMILNKPNKPVKSRIESTMRIPEAIPLPTMLPRTEKATEISTESFDQKLENILNG